MKLSIITINLNNKEGLQKTIESVISQTFTDFEYIVIDGASTDGSVDIIRKYEDKIAYWISEPDKGIYNAMNKGILQAKGEYCLFMNSGDYLIRDNVIEKIFSLNFTEDIICKKVHDRDQITFFDLYKIHFSHQTMFIKRNLFEKIGLYKEEYKIISDWVFSMEALFRNNASIRLYDFLVYISQPGGISMTDGELFAKEQSNYLSTYWSRFYPDYELLRNYKASRFIKIYDRLYNNSYLYRFYSKILKWMKLK